MNKIGYWEIGYKGKRYLGHRIAWAYETGKWPEFEIDHKSRDGSSLKFDDLREATSLQNKYNIGKRKNNTTGFIGVSFSKRQMRYRAYHGVDRAQIHLGYFDTAEEASAAYQAAIAYRGEFLPSNIC